MQLVLRLEGAEAAKHAAEESLRSACARAEVLEAEMQTLQARGTINTSSGQECQAVCNKKMVAMLLSSRRSPKVSS